MTPTGHAIRTGIGAALRAERERRRISLDAVARGTLVRHDFLELIDGDRLEDLPSGAYAKGFIRSYAIYLGLDPKPFLTRYEERCGRPEPELSRVVRRGVRVPPRAHKRAWQLSIFGAASVLLVLALLGAFRSGNESSNLPVSPAAARVVGSSAPTITGTVVRVEAISHDVWLQVDADGHKIFANTLRRGDFRTFKGDDEIVITLTRSSDIRVTANGKVLGSPKVSPYRGVFTPGTSMMPPNEPLLKAAPPPSSEPTKADGAPPVPQNAYTGQ
jgi:cytoskeleton protein RodZ